MSSVRCLASLRCSFPPGDFGSKLAKYANGWWCHWKSTCSNSFFCSGVRLPVVVELLRQDGVDGVDVRQLAVVRGRGPVAVADVAVLVARIAVLIEFGA